MKIKSISDTGILESLKSAEGRWLVQFTKDRPDGMGFTIHSYMVDPQDGRVLERLVYGPRCRIRIVLLLWRRSFEVSLLRQQDGAVALMRGTVEASRESNPADETRARTTN